MKSLREPFPDFIFDNHEDHFHDVSQYAKTLALAFSQEIFLNHIYCPC